MIPKEAFCMNRCLIINPKEFFKEKIDCAVAKQNIPVGEDIEFYLVNLLCGFIVPEKVRIVSEEIDVLATPLALMLKKALETTHEEDQLKLYKSIGDTSLYLAGYFQDSFNNKSYDIDYMITIGSSAYVTVSDLMRSKTSKKKFSPMYEMLGKKFDLYVDIVADVSDSIGEMTTKNLIAWYERWMKFPTERLEKKLEKNGVPLSPLLKKRVCQN